MGADARCGRPCHDRASEVVEPHVRKAGRSGDLGKVRPHQPIGGGGLSGVGEHPRAKRRQISYHR